MTSDKSNTADVLIIGGGIAGIMAARKLEKQGISVIVFDKSSSVGGRMATRRVGPGLADHGAQFFTARSPEFQTMIDGWVNENMVYEWSKGFSDGSLMPPTYDGHSRYAVHGGLNALPKHLAKDLKDIRLDTQIFTATCDDSGWILQDQEGDLYLGKALIMTPPIPQAHKILTEGATVLQEKDDEALQKIDYAPCLTGIFWVEGRVTLPPPGAVQRRTSNIAWIGDNQAKGISPKASIITVQANETYSSQMWNSPDERIMNALRTDLRIFIHPDATIKEEQLKRWRYSRPLTTYPDTCLVADNTPTLIFAGDAFGGPRVEGAVLSGISAGTAMLEALS